MFACVVFGCRHRSSIYNKQLRNGTWADAQKNSRGFSMFSTLTYTGVPYHWYRGVHYLEEGKDEQAFVNFEVALKYNPYNAHVLNDLGVGYAKQGRYEVAEKCLRLALKYCPKLKKAQTNIEVLNGLSKK
jgi:tetratricopeptide (TPR) repeat protein